jgi:hypothetical protein
MAADTKWLMDYCVSKPLAIIRYFESDMVLYVHSDASYLSETRSRSRAGGHFFLSSKPTDPNTTPTQIPPLNGPVHTVCKILKVVVGSAAEAEIGGVYINAQDAVPMIVALEEMGHSQPPIPIQVDNTTAEGYSNETIKPKRSKAMDMRYHWIQDRVRQKMFLVYYRPGSTNLADPFTKHHPPEHLRIMRPKYLLPNRTENLAYSAISLIYKTLLR